MPSRTAPEATNSSPKSRVKRTRTRRGVSRRTRARTRAPRTERGSRSRVRVKRCVAMSDSVALSGHGLDDGGVNELAPQPVDGGLDRGGAGVGDLVPHLGEQFAGRYGPS